MQPAPSPHGVDDSTLPCRWGNGTMGQMASCPSYLAMAELCRNISVLPNKQVSGGFPLRHPLTFDPFVGT